MDVAELTKVRLVRCPKCKNLLPELPDCPLYLCGGCGTVLEGTKSQNGDGAPSTSDAAVEVRDTSDSEMKLNAEPGSLRLTGLAAGFVKGINEKSTIGGAGGGDENLTKMKAKPRENEGEKVSEFSRSGRIQVAQSGEEDEREGLRGVRDGRYSTSSYPVEGSSTVNSSTDPSLLRVSYQEDDRAELLRKLEELKEQLIRSSLLTTRAPPCQGTCSGSILTHGVHPSLQNLNQIPLCGDHFGAQIPRIEPQYHQGSFPGQFYQSYGKNPQFEPCRLSSSLHPPMCSCYYCCSKHSAIASFHHQGQSTGVPALLPLNNNSFQSFPRWNPNGTARRKVASRGRLLHPKSGGAPFISCKKCSELIILPEKVLLDGKWQKIQCGSCSAIISISLVDKKMVFSSNSELGGNSHRHGHTRRGNLTFSSNDFDDSCYDFQAVDPDPDPHSAKPVELQSFSSSSCSFYENGNLDSAEQSVKANHSGSSPESPLHQQDDSSNPTSSVSRSGKGNLSKRSDQEKGNARQNSMKEATLATETDVSYESKTSKNESFFTSFINNFKDTKVSHSDDDSKTVSVNGHIIPRKQVSKAEKHAGPIYPGNYWYDGQAGFWGVAGGHCLGMIPPLIKEFNFPMPQNCSKGDTGVFVNGRELHRKDLELLASRGLPTERNRYYIVSISGKVVDEESGEELDSLGKLAPTIEKRKLGFGMKVPKICTP